MNFITLSYQPINPFDFDTKAEYDAYVRDNEYRTLQGERVKGYQELVIANWLFMNGVRYEYEAPYISKRRLEIGFDYQPDFHVSGSNIYLEHFGIDRSGNTREDIDKESYNKGIIAKRQLHKECGTKLIETYHYDWVEGNLEMRLQQLMDESGVELTPISDEKILESLKSLGFIKEGAKRYLKCLQAIRVERLDKALIEERLKSKSIFYSKRYTILLYALHQAYVEELRAQNRIDFDDMIIRAITALNDGSFKPKWRHILVDEFVVVK